MADPTGQGSAPGESAQDQVFARLPSGDYLQVRQDKGEIIVSRFTSELAFVWETRYADLSYQFKLADLNGDGFLDLLGSRLGGPHNSSVIGVFLGTVEGWFRAPVEYALPGGNAPYCTVGAFSLGDVDGDGSLDVITPLPCMSPGTGALALLRGNGDGTFRQGARIGNLDAPNASSWLWDLNGDGRLDLVFAGQRSDSDSFVRVAPGIGDGTFGAEVEYRMGGYGGLALGDVDGDGAADIVTNGVSILFGDGKGGFPRRADYLSESRSGIVLTDFDHDGRTDIVEGVYGNALAFTAASTSISVLFGRGGGTFWGARPSEISWPGGTRRSIYDVAAADLNGDETPDLAVSAADGILTVLEGTADGLFHQVFQYQLPDSLYGNPVVVLAEDFNGDGKRDLAVGVQWYSSERLNYVLAFEGVGDGTFREPRALALDRGLRLATVVAGDYSGDGAPDLAVVVSAQDAGTADAVLVSLGNGDMTFNPPVTYAAGPVAVAAVNADFNGDGRLDLAVADRGTGSSDGNIRVLLGAGDGTFSAALPMPVAAEQGQGPFDLAAADFNGDGKTDLAVTLTGAAGSAKNLAVLLGRGDGTFQAGAEYAVSEAELAVSDLDGDGFQDLIVNTGYLRGRGDGTFAPETAIANAAGPLAIADFNGDGQPDLAAGSGVWGLITFLNESRQKPAFTVVSSASYAQGPIAPDSLVSVFGEEVAFGTASAEAGIPADELAGTSVTVRGEAGESLAAPLLYVSPNQINFVVPAGSSTGAGWLSISSTTGSMALTVSFRVEIAQVSPALFSLNRQGLAAAYVVRVAGGGAQSIEQVFRVEDGIVKAAPIDLGPETDQVYLALFGTGLRKAAPADVAVSIGGQSTAVTYAGAQGALPGLDQVNVQLPRALAGRGSVPIALTAGQTAANVVYVTVR